VKRTVRSSMPETLPKHYKRGFRTFLFIIMYLSFVRKRKAFYFENFYFVHLFFRFIYYISVCCSGDRSDLKDRLGSSNKNAFGVCCSGLRLVYRVWTRVGLGLGFVLWLGLGSRLG
jgi:hypothetical protein